ncbi:Imm49 family immunity protein [Haladaptatus sp. DYSN1]|uniref:Imm49 family immunity protein n=1 Tax=unclassified Haladaptatus TaxID=2622732 RepID=UPI002404EAEC|nr:Imm49 family immunity protein [Haladaptatus sp. DYSN1]
MRLNENELQERRGRLLDSRQVGFFAVNRMTEEGRVPVSAFNKFYLTGRDLGTTELLLGNTKTAQQWFAEGALGRTMSCSLIRQHEITDGGYLGALSGMFEEAIRTALLAADPRVVGATATEILALEESYLDQYPHEMTRYWRLTGLAAFLLGDTEHAHAALETVSETFASESEEVSVDPLGEALSDILDGLLADNATAAQRGLDALDQSHRVQVPDDPYASEDVLDHYTSAYLVLARHRGMDIRVENEYVPTAVYEIDWSPVELPTDTPNALRDLYETAAAIE